MWLNGSFVNKLSGTTVSQRNVQNWQYPKWTIKNDYFLHWPTEDYRKRSKRSFLKITGQKRSKPIKNGYFPHYFDRFRPVWSTGAEMKVSSFFKLHHLKINPDKTEFIIFGSSNPQDKTTLKVGDKLISSKAEIKHLGVYIDKDLKYRKLVNNFLSRMAQGIKCIYAPRNIVPTIYKKLILSSFVLSHVQCSSVLLATINQNLIRTLEKQLNWAIKACFHRQKFDSSSDLKMKLDIIPI